MSRQLPAPDGTQLLLSEALGPLQVETFSLEGDLILRSIQRRDGSRTTSAVHASAETAAIPLPARFDLEWLRGTSLPQPSTPPEEQVRIVDLFSGSGGLSVGLAEAARALELEAVHVWAAELEADYLDVYTANLRPLATHCGPVEQVLDGGVGDPLSSSERELRDQCGKVHIVAGGPPCQGHSNLNNHTRRRDPKNILFERMARAAEVLEPDHVIIENVPGVKHDKNDVFGRTLRALSELGYRIDEGKIAADRIGVPQRRHRTFIVASKVAPISTGFMDDLVKLHGTEPRSVGWACQDLLDVESAHPFDSSTESSAVSQERIDWLFENDAHDLPDRLRPDCHRTKSHTYKSVYGRLFWDQPSWTITTGFTVMGQGRFVHPLRRRVITPHEAARLQFIPDFFSFGDQTRKGYAKMIGNAVPPKLAYVIGVELLR